MKVTYNGRTFEFRACDCKGLTANDLQSKCDLTGYMQHEVRGSWLVIPGIGYGWEVNG